MHITGECVCGQFIVCSLSACFYQETDIKSANNAKNDIYNQIIKLQQIFA